MEANVRVRHGENGQGRSVDEYEEKDSYLQPAGGALIVLYTSWPIRWKIPLQLLVIHSRTCSRREEVKAVSTWEEGVDCGSWKVGDLNVVK